MIDIDDHKVSKKGNHLHVDEKVYLQRGNQSLEELKQLWRAIKEKNPNTKLTFEKWLVEYGKVYIRVRG